MGLAMSRNPDTPDTWREKQETSDERINEETQENFKTAPSGRTSCTGTQLDGGWKWLQRAIRITLAQGAGKQEMCTPICLFSLF